MNTSNIANKFAQKFYYGWLIIGMAALSLFFSAPGQTYSISTFINSYITDFGFSRTLISSIYSAATICSGLLIVFMGKAVDRFGQRKMTVIAGIMLSITCLFNSFIGNIFMISVGFFFLRYFGQGSLTLIPGSLIPQWFDKKRAFAISLSNLGGVASNMLIPAFNIFLITTFSWQFAWRVWSILLLVGFVPIAFSFIINKPEDIGLLPDNEKVKSHEEVKQNLLMMEKESWHLNEAVKTKEFWFVGLISMIAPMISTGMMFHFFSLMELKGLTENSAAFVIGLAAFPGIIMPIVSNLIIDRFRSKYILTFTLIIITIDMLFLLTVSSVWTAAIFMLIYGLAINIQNVTISVIWPRYFGRKNLGSIRGAATVFMVIGSALGPLPFGLSYDLTGDYNFIIIGMGIVTLLSVIMSLSIQKPKRDHA